jgi:hypothetical protein
MIKNESSLSIFLILIAVPLSAMEPDQPAYNFQTYSGTQLHEFARQHSVINLTLRSRMSFFNRMKDLEIPDDLASVHHEGKVEDLSDITRKKKSCCIIL